MAFTVDTLRQRGGPCCRFRAVVTIGLQAGQRDSEPFDLAALPRGLHLRLRPQDCAPHTVKLSAFIDTRGLGGVAAQDVAWASERDGNLGRRYQLSATLNEGLHIITATIPDGLGGRLAERGIIIIVGGRPQAGSADPMTSTPQPALQTSRPVDGCCGPTDRWCWLGCRRSCGAVDC